MHSVKADVCLFRDESLRSENFSPFCFMINSQQFQGISSHVYSKIVFTCLFYRILEILVTRVRVECNVIFTVLLCLLYTNVMCNNAFKT